MDQRVITMPSQTAAIKAQRMLQKNGITGKVVRIDPRRTPRGCGWGLNLSVFTVNQAIFLMNSAGIAMGELLSI